jgi:IS5 family transposase
MENRHGLCADITLHNPIGEPEPRVALRQIDEHQQLHDGTTPRTLAGDKNYHQKELVRACRQRGIAPHVACKEKLKTPGLDARTTTTRAYQTSQRVRKRIEEIFGWMKTVGGLRRSRYLGLERTQAWSYFVAGTYNLLRMTRLQAAAAA